MRRLGYVKNNNFFHFELFTFELRIKRSIKFSNSIFKKQRSHLKKKFKIPFIFLFFLLFSFIKSSFFPFSPRRSIFSKRERGEKFHSKKNVILLSFLLLYYFILSLFHGIVLHSLLSLFLLDTILRQHRGKGCTRDFSFFGIDSLAWFSKTIATFATSK